MKKLLENFDIRWLPIIPEFQKVDLIREIKRAGEDATRREDKMGYVFFGFGSGIRGLRGFSQIIDWLGDIFWNQRVTTIYALLYQALGDEMLGEDGNYRYEMNIGYNGKPYLEIVFLQQHK